MWQKVKCFSITIILACLVMGQVKVPDGLLDTLKDELKYESIFVLQNPSISCEINLNMETVTPIINFNENQNYSLKPHFNSRFMAIVCLAEPNSTTFETLFINLNGMRNTPTLFLINNEVNLSDIFMECFNNQMLNVVAIENWNPEQIYSYRAFPCVQLIERNISEVKVFFKSQMRNLGGFPIMSMPDNILPRNVVYKDRRGRPQLTGYLVTFLNNFAETLNTTLKICWHRVPLDLPEKILGNEVLRSVGRRSDIDIPLSIVHIVATLHSQRMIGSYVMEIAKSQLLLPIEPEADNFLLITAAKCWHIMFLGLLTVCLLSLLLENNHRLDLGESPRIWCLNIFFKTILRAVLYQTFVLRHRPSRRVARIYILLFFYSFLVYNIYIAQLEMLLVYPPQATPISNYQELRRSGIKILISPDDEWIVRSSLGHQHMNDFADVYYRVNSSVFQSLRRQPNSSYAYPITQTLWPLIQHKFIKQPRGGFRLSEDFVFLSFVPFVLPLPKNSIYEETLNKFILNTHCSGLYSLWFRQSFQSLVEIGKMEVLPYKSPTEFYHILRWKDFYLAWKFFSLYMVMAILCFIIEVTKVCANLRNRRFRNYL